MELPKYIFKHDGLRFDVVLLRDILHSKALLSQGLNEHAEYVDGITYELVKENQIELAGSINIPVDELKKLIHKGGINLTSIGNIAFIALYAKTETQRVIAKQTYDNIILILRKNYENC